MKIEICIDAIMMCEQNSSFSPKAHQSQLVTDYWKLWL